MPEHLLILGGGYIGAELGQAFHRFGSRVIIVQRAPHFLPNEDVDVSDAVEALAREDGLNLVCGAEAIKVNGRSGHGVGLTVRTPAGDQHLAATDLLVAVGRTSMTRDVGLEAAGVQLDPRGFIRVNDHLETSAPSTSAPSTWALSAPANSGP